MVFSVSLLSHTQYRAPAGGWRQLRSRAPAHSIDREGRFERAFLGRHRPPSVGSGDVSAAQATAEARISVKEEPLVRRQCSPYLQMLVA